MRLLLGALCVVCANAAEVDYAMKLQQTLGSASIAYKESNFDGTLSKLEQLQKTIAEWRAAVVAKKAAGAAPVEPEKEPEPPAESVEFFVNQTHVPDKCKRKAEAAALTLTLALAVAVAVAVAVALTLALALALAKAEEGATMRVHYVGKLLTGAWASKYVCKQVSTDFVIAVHRTFVLAVGGGTWRIVGRAQAVHEPPTYEPTSKTDLRTCCGHMTDLRTCCGQGRRRCLPRPSTRDRRPSSSSSARARCSRGGP